MRRLVVTAAALTLVLAVTACAGKKKDGGQGGFGAETPTPSASASATASPGGSVTPSTSTSSSAPSDPLGPVTHGAIASKAGFVWEPNGSAATYNATGSYWYNSTGGGITITRTSTGRYDVVFAGLGTAGGVAQAQAYGSAANFCNVVRWGPSGADEAVSIACYDSGTAPVDTQFVANFAVGHQSGAHFSYLWLDQPSQAGKHQVASTYRYDSTGHEPTVQRLSAGKYRVFLPASYDEQNEPYSFQVTAYGAATFRCKLSKAFVAAGTHDILCTDAPGTPYDTQFVLSYAAEGSLIGRTDNRYGGYSQTDSGVTQSGTGVYTVAADGLGQPRGHVVVGATGSNANYCHVGSWSPSGDALKMIVRCFAPNGSPTNAGFRLGVTW
jgi:hypothetical protein